MKSVKKNANNAMHNKGSIFILYVKTQTVIMLT